MSERRAAILRAAARLFEHYGHGKTTIADVAREAEIGVGTVYLEFDSKEAIVKELSHETHSGVLESMREAMKGERDDGKRFAAVMMARTKCYIELRTKGQHACELLHCQRTVGVRSASEHFREQEQALLVEVLEQGKKSGSFQAKDPKRSAVLIQRAFATLSPPGIFGSDDDLIETARHLSALLLEGLRKR